MNSCGDCCIILNWKCLFTDSSGVHQLLGEYRCFCFQYNVNINIGKHCTLSLCCFYSINPLIPTITCNHHTFQKALKWIWWNENKNQMQNSSNGEWCCCFKCKCIIYLFFGFINNFIALLNKIQQNVAYCKFKHDLHPDAESYRKNLSVRWMKTFSVEQSKILFTVKWVL